MKNSNQVVKLSLATKSILNELKYRRIKQTGEFISQDQLILYLACVYQKLLDGQEIPS